MLVKTFANASFTVILPFHFSVYICSLPIITGIKKARWQYQL